MPGGGKMGKDGLRKKKQDRTKDAWKRFFLIFWDNIWHVLQVLGLVSVLSLFAVLAICLVASLNYLMPAWVEAKGLHSIETGFISVIFGISLVVLFVLLAAYHVLHQKYQPPLDPKIAVAVLLIVSSLTLCLITGVGIITLTVLSLEAIKYIGNTLGPGLLRDAAEPYQHLLLQTGAIYWIFGFSIVLSDVSIFFIPVREVGVVLRMLFIYWQEGWRKREDGSLYSRRNPQRFSFIVGVTARLDGASGAQWVKHEALCRDIGCASFGFRSQRAFAFAKHGPVQINIDPGNTVRELDVLREQESLYYTSKFIPHEQGKDRQGGVVLQFPSRVERKRCMARMKILKDAGVIADA
jgi:hypothetical protein